ncbi:MAG: Ku protein [Patescibacteria group bacterium]|jgi:DNA end-binding protein Ku
MKSIWTGTISFGLVNIPVRLYTATKQRRLEFDYLRKDDLCPVGYERICKTTGEKVPYENIVRGYEYRKGKYVVLDNEDFEKANVRKTNSIQIVDLVDEVDIDSKYYQKPFYLEAGKGSEKAYVLLREALRKSGKVGIARFILKTREHLGVIKPEDDMLMLNQMRFDSDIRKPTDLYVPRTVLVSEEEMSAALQLIDRLSTSFNPEKYQDIYTQELKETIEEKAQGREVPPLRIEKPQPTEIAEILKRLRESVDQLQRKTTYTAR